MWPTDIQKDFDDQNENVTTPHCRMEEYVGFTNPNFILCVGGINSSIFHQKAAPSILISSEAADRNVGKCGITFEESWMDCFTKAFYSICSESLRITFEVRNPVGL
ncbi:hypothetical protein TNCV_2996161 [Trichonephila clavipes]|nr:hypothetical protein TNCV_2996161 [Trichonephila clavipes]